jgi:hypothetical protein
MTAAEWADCDRPDDMLTAARERLTDRQLLLFACGCCRLTRTATADFSQTADVIERLLDTHARPRGQSIFEAIQGVLTGNVAGLIAQTLSLSSQGTWQLARQTSALCRAVELQTQAGVPVGTFAPPADARQGDLLRDILGDPFRPVPFDPRWRTSTVIELATAIEADRAWDRLPILADALQDAGCDDPRVLDHCRGRGEHVRGCWIVDGCLER